jgi:TRAP-type C4-dicarboxylate transport system substrate-binding protein
MRALMAFAVVAAFGCGSREPGGARVIRFPQAVNEQHPRVMASRFFAERLAEESGGRYRIEILSGGQLYSARQAVAAAALGDAEMAMEPETHYIAFDPLFKAIDLPFVFDTPQKFQAFLEGEFRSRVQPSLARGGLELLALWDEGPMLLASRERLLRSPELFRGVKIRTSGHELLARSWNEMGAATLSLPVDEVYTALQQGVADAVYTTLNAHVSGKFHEVAPKALLWPARATYVWVVNRAFWDGLAPADRDLIERLVAETGERYHQLLEEQHPGMVRTIEHAPGGEFAALAPSEQEVFRSRLGPLLALWLREYASLLGGLAGS